MDPAQKILLDEINKRFSARFDGVERRFDTLEKKLDATAHSSSTCLDALENAAKAFDECRPWVDGVIDDLRGEVNHPSSLKLEVGKISKYMERSMVEGPTLGPKVHGSMPSVLALEQSPKAPTPKVFSAPTSPCVDLKDVKPTFSPNFKSTGADEFQAAPRSSAGTSANMLNGHCVSNGNRDGAFGVDSTI